MTLKLADRIKETTTTTGTGTLTLAGAMTGFSAFSSALSNADTCYYALQAVDGSGNPTGAWEVGLGTYTTSGNTLSRTLIASSTGSLISLAAGTTQVWIDVGAARFVALNAAAIAGQVPVLSASGLFTPTAFALAALTDVQEVPGPAVSNNALAYSTAVAKWTPMPLTLGFTAPPTYDPNATGSAITLSSGNTVATVNSTAQWANTHATGPKSSGKLYVEFTATVAGTGTSDGEGFGVVNALASFVNGNTGLTGADTNGVMAFTRQSGNASGLFYNNAVVSGSSGNFVITTGMVVGVAVDFSLKKIWFWNPTAGKWNYDVLANQNPATGTGGFDLTTILTANPNLYLATSLIYTTTAPVVSINPGTAAFSNPVPLGFSPWATTPTPVLSDTNITLPNDGDVAVYSANAGKWQNVPAPNASLGFVDGNFDQWNVNTTFSLAAATDTYTADMWVCNAGTGGAATVSRNTATLGAEIAGMTRPRQYRLSYQQTTNASTSPTVGQKLEGVGQYNGQSITVQATLAAAVAASLVVGVKYTQNFGTGGSPSTAVTATTTVAWPILTTEKKFSVRLDIPSISGKTLGTGGNDFLRIDLLLATGATYTLYHSQLQIDAALPTSSSDTTGLGGQPLPFRYAGLEPEQLRVERFLEKSYDRATLPGTVATNGQDLLFQNNVTSGTPSCGGPVGYRTRKRTAVTPTYYSPNSGASGKVYDAASSADVTPTTLNIGEGGFVWFATTATTQTSCNFRTHWVADARL